MMASSPLGQLTTLAEEEEGEGKGSSSEAEAISQRG